MTKKDKNANTNKIDAALLGGRASALKVQKILSEMLLKASE